MTQNNPYGYFDDAAQEYVILTPNTPYPWTNYLGNGDFLGLISNTAGGYCFYRDAKLRRLIRYRYNSLPIDNGGRYFYIRDGENTWSPSFKPLRRELDEYECRHGLGYTTIHSSVNQLSCESLFMVPMGCNAEVHRLTLTNHSQEKRSIQLFSYLEWCLWNAEDDMTNFQRNYSTGEVEVDASTIYHKTEYRERRDHYGFYSVNHPVTGFDTDRDAFLGAGNGVDSPAVVLAGESQNSIAYGWSPIASHCIELDLEPGQSHDLVFVLGYVRNEPDQKWESKGVINKQPAQELRERFAMSAQVDEAREELAQHWRNLLGTLTVSSGDAKLDRLVNVWNPYQNTVTFNLSRSASMFESGVSRGMGFRDSNQDLLGNVHTMPERARQRIIDLASTQLSDGSAFHQYQPLTKRGNAAIGSGFNDDPLWLIVSTVAYIKETGDLAFLETPTPFADVPGSTAVLFDHLKASFCHVTANRGPHGLPLIGRADWNDCLNLNCFSTNPDESFQTTEIETAGKAESVMIAGLFVWTGKDYQELCERSGRDAEAASASAALTAMVKAVEQHGWDGDWFLRAYRHDGEKVGSDSCEEGKIFVEPQGLCVMAGIGTRDGRALQAMDSVQERLDCEHGVVLLHPAYSRYDVALGEISSYPQGYKENGAVFCHTNPWIVIAETVLGRGDRAFQYMCKTAPPYREDKASLHKTEPYVYAQMIAGKEAHRPGEAKNSWLTGTAAWSYYATTQFILGIRPDFDGLRFDPCIPKDWPSFQVTRVFRGATFQVQINNPAHVSKGVGSMTLNGESLPGNLIPPQATGTTHQVVVTLG